MNKLYEDLEKYVKDHFKTPDHNVFHYTTQESYDNITRTQFLTLNPHTYLNKKNPENRELEIAYDLIINELNSSQTIPNERINFEEFIQRGIVFYTASFSLNQSLDLANYGEYCLEFDVNLLKNLPNKQATLFSEVEYNEEKSKEIIHEMFSKFDHYWDSNSNDKKSLIDSLFIWLITIMPLIKSKENSSENECRIIQFEGFDSRNHDLMTPGITKKIDFRKSDIKIHRTFA